MVLSESFSLFWKWRKGESALQKSNLTSVRFDFQASTDAIWVFRETCWPVRAGRKGWWRYLVLWDWIPVPPDGGIGAIFTSSHKYYILLLPNIFICSNCLQTIKLQWTCRVEICQINLQFQIKAQQLNSFDISQIVVFVSTTWDITYLCFSALRNLPRHAGNSKASTYFN